MAPDSEKETNGSQTLLLTKNESTYISIGVSRMPENVVKVGLKIIETQSASYLGKGDIVRFEDNYGRLKSGGDSKVDLE